MESRNNRAFCIREISNYLKKQKRKIIAGLCTVLFLIQSGFSVYAIENTFYLQGYEARENVISISCSALPEDDIDSKAFELSLGSQRLSIASVSTIAKEEKRITYYCLVDVSGSMREKQMEQIKEMLKSLGASLKNGDNMVIATLGNQTTDSGFLSEQTQITEEIEKLAIGKEDTNLYAGIVASMDRLATAAETNQEKCLLIFSDGKDDQKVGITQQEALDKVEQANVPVYTTAFVRNTSDSEQLETAKVLGSFARSSAGGKHFVPDLDGLTTEEVIQEIIHTEQAGIILTADISDISIEKDVLLLRVIYTASDESRQEDTIEVFGQDIINAQIAKKEISTEETEIETENTEDSVIPDKIIEERDFVIPLIVVAIVLAIISVIWILKKRKKQQEQTEEIIEESNKEEISEEILPKDVIEEKEEKYTDINGQKSNSISLKNIELDFSKSCVLKLTAIGYSEIFYYITLEEGKNMTLGRDNRADIVIGDGDRKISGIHCTVKWENGVLHVWDTNSTNGTFVNGIPIKNIGKVAVHEGEIIRIGTYEYRITIEK